MRQDLNALYHKLSQVGTTVRPLGSDSSIQTEISERETELVSLLRDAGSEKEGWATLETMSPPGVRDIQQMLGR